MPDPFAVLELPITATEAELKLAYRRLVGLYHPDHNPGFQDEAHAKMRELNEAYAEARASFRTGLAGGAFAPRSGSAGGGPTQAPPKPPPRYRGPTVPPVRYPETTPGWDRGPGKLDPAADAALRARRAAFVADLVDLGFLGGAAEAERGHPVLDAFVPVFPDGGRLKSCAAYAGFDAAGPERVPLHRHHFQHAVPSASVGGIAARTEAIDRIQTASFVACATDRLLWTQSSFAGGDGILLREDIAVHAAPFDTVTRVERRRGEVRVALSDGRALAFTLDRSAAARLAEAVVAGA